MKIPDDEKFAYIQKLKKHAYFPEAKIIDIDGLRVEFADSWGVIRVSNTTPCITLRFEADTKNALLRIQQCFKAFMLQYKPDLEVGF